MKRRVLLLALLGAPLLARAGAQLEEPLADAIRSALSASIAQSAPPRPKFEASQVDARMAYLRWLGEMSERLKKRKTETQIRIEFLETVWYEAKRAGLEPSLVLGLIQVESGFRKYAISVAGARGYMQVMPFWTKAIGDGEWQWLERHFDLPVLGIGAFARHAFFCGGRKICVKFIVVVVVK